MIGARVVDEVVQEVTPGRPAGVDGAQDVDEDRGRGARSCQPLEQVRARAARSPSNFTARYWRSTSASHSARSAALEPKWCVISPGETPARTAIVRNDASNPSSAKHSIAASRILARAVRSDASRPSDVGGYTHDPTYYTG